MRVKTKIKHIITKAAGPQLGISNSLWKKIEKNHEEANETLAKNRIHPRCLLAWKVGIFDLKEETAKILRRKIRSPFFSLQGLRERSKSEGSMNQKMNIHHPGVTLFVAFSYFVGFGVREWRKEWVWRINLFWGEVLMADKACFHLSLIGSFSLSLSNSQKGLSFFVVLALMLCCFFVVDIVNVWWHPFVVWYRKRVEKESVFVEFFFGEILVALFCFVFFFFLVVCDCDG